MKIEMLNNPTLDYVDSGIGMCWDKGAYGSDTEKGKERIIRICKKYKHKSMMRFATYIFRVIGSSNEIYDVFKGYKYAVVKGNKDNYIVKISAQGLDEITLPDFIKQDIIPENHKFLFVKEGDKI